MSESIWKKEITLRRKKPVAVAPAPAPAPAAPAQSIWKKEITLRRKRPAVEAPAPASVAAPPKQSIWKKEISFRRKKPAVAPPPPPVVAPEPPSLWKTEVSVAAFKRRREIKRLAQSAAEAVSPAFAPEEVPPPPVAALLEAVVDAPQPEPPEFAPAPVPSPPLPEPPAAPAASVPPLLGAVVEASRPVESQPVEPQPVEPPPVEPAGELAWVSPQPAAAEPWSAGPELPPEPEPAPPAHVPVPSAPEPVAAVESEPEALSAWPEPEPAAPEPWNAAPELPPVPLEPEQLEPEAVEPEQLEPELVAPAEPVLPIAVAVPVPVEPVAVVPEPAPPVPETSIWKKEISFRRKPKAPKPPKAEKPPKAPKPPKAEKPPKPPKPPRERRRPSLPARRAGGHPTTRLVGLKVGASQIAAARIANNGVAQLEQLARRPLEPGIVVDGELRDPDALAAALRAFFSANKLPRRGVRLGIASNRIGVRTIEIAGVDDDRQLANAVRFRAQEALPVPLDEAVLDYRVLDERLDAEGRTVKRVLLVVAHRDLVERYVAACRKAGIVLGGVDLEAFALLRSLAAPGDREGSALVAVAVGHERTTLAVSDGRVCEFTRVLEWGGWALNVALARALDSAPSEVEELKRSLSLAEGPAPQGLTPEQAAKAVDAVRRQVESFARELVSSLQFYQAQPGSLGIGEIVVTGGTAQLAGLAEELEHLVGVRVRVGNPLDRLVVSKRVDEADLGSLAIAIGLGIED